MRHVKMKLLLITFSTIIPIINSIAPCQLGCTCSNDDSCEYYCQSYKCQEGLYYGSKCMGHYIHPRECHIGFCDPLANYTCRFKKFTGVMCSGDYACYSEYCDLTLGTCQYKSKDSSSSKLTLILLGSIGGPIILMTAVTIIYACVKKRLRNPILEPVHIIVATIHVRAEENEPTVQESLPPSYTESVSIPSNTTINNNYLESSTVVTD